MTSIPTTLRRRTVILFLLLATVAACGEAPTAPARAVAGCYALTLSRWAGDASEIGALPDSVRLLDVRGASALEVGRTLLRAYPDSSRSHFRWAWWEPVTPDTLRIIFSTGYTGARLELRPEGAGFAGRVTAFVDYGADPATATARLTPFACRD